MPNPNPRWMTWLISLRHWIPPKVEEDSDDFPFLLTRSRLPTPLLVFCIFRVPRRIVYIRDFE